MATTLPATKSQVQFLHHLYRALNWDQDTYRAVLDEQYGVTSTNDLTIAQANELIHLLKSVVNGYDYERITPKQVALIRSQWLHIDYSNGEKGDLHLNAFIQKRFRKGNLEALSKTEATKLIKMIGAMTKQAAARAGKTTVINRHSRCEYCGGSIMWVELKNRERVPFDVTIKHGEYVATDFHNCKELRE